MWIYPKASSCRGKKPQFGQSGTLVGIFLLFTQGKVPFCHDIFQKAVRHVCVYALISPWANAASSDPLLPTAQYKFLWLSCKQRKWCWWIKQKNLLTLLSKITSSTNGNAGSALLESNSTQNLHSVNHPFPLIMKKNTFPYILINLKNIMQIEKCTFVRMLSGSTFHSGGLFVSTGKHRESSNKLLWYTVLAAINKSMWRGVLKGKMLLSVGVQFNFAQN